MQRIRRSILLVIPLTTLFAQALHAQWVRTDIAGKYPQCFAASDTNLFVGTADSGVYVSTNGGMSWTSANTGLTDTRVYALAVTPTTAGKNLLAGTLFSGVFLSTNNGTSWTTTGSAGMANATVWGLALLDTAVYAAASNVWRSTDRGESWSSMGLSDAGAYAVAISDTNLFAGTYLKGVYRSTDRGASWNQAWAGIEDTTVISLAVSDAGLLAGTLGGGVYYSTTNGTGWVQAKEGLTNLNIHSLVTLGGNTFAGTEAGVFLSTNNGTSWASVTGDLPNTRINSLAILPTSTELELFAGTYGSGAWSRSISGMITSVGKSPRQNISNECFLKQNYPNPFNPTTEISYSLPRQSRVTLMVYDILGRVVEALVDEVRPAGQYTVEWNAARHPSGVYSYRLQAGNFVETKKMLLLR